MKPITPPIDLAAPIKVILIFGGLFTIRMLFEQNSYSMPSPTAEFVKNSLTIIAAIFIYIKLLKPDRSNINLDKAIQRLENQIHIRTSQLKRETQDPKATYSLQDFIEDQAEKYLGAKTDEEKTQIRQSLDDAHIAYHFLDHLEVPIASKRRNQIEPKTPGDIALEFALLLKCAEESFNPTTASNTKILETTIKAHLINPTAITLQILKQVAQHISQNPNEK